MGLYVNPGNGLFQEALDSQIYVDKTGVIVQTNSVFKTRRKYICVSRPRRFGKSMALDMLCAYYCRTCDSRAQFAGLAAADEPSFYDHLNRYDVVRLVMTEFLGRGDGTVPDMLAALEKRVMRELAQAYPDAPRYDDDTLADALAQAYAATGVPFVFLIDEWDCVMRTMQSDEQAQRCYLDWLRNLLKDREYVGLAYATGILPVKKYGEHSALNMFDEVSVLNAVPYSEFTGFTEGEVEGLCDRFGMDVDETRRWYDGYDVDGLHVYNPRSVVAAMEKGVFDSYWTKTETFEALRRYIVLDMDGLREKVVRLIAGDSMPVNTSKFQNTMDTFESADDVLTLLVHLGYLTYDRASGTVRVPNSEVTQEFVSCIEDGGWEPVANAIADSAALVTATVAGDGERVAELVGRAHRENASVLACNDENSLVCAVSIAYYAARRDYRIEREAPAGKGFADLVFWPRPDRDVPAMIVELKAGGTAEDAVAQIRAREYASAVADYPGALLVGIAYEPDARKPGYKDHCCVIEPAERWKS